MLTQEKVWLMADVLGIETYDYPKVDFVRGEDEQTRVRFSEGWFLPGIDEDEPAYYMDYYLDKNGRVILIIDAFWQSFGRVLARGGEKKGACSTTA